MNKILSLIYYNPDKLLHFIVGYMMAQLCFFIPYINILAIIPIVYMIALAKELVDSIRETGVFSWYDLLCTVIGGILGFIIMLIK